MRKSLRTVLTTTAAALAVSAFTMTAAVASTTTIHRDSATGAAYSGNLHGDLISSVAKFESSAGNGTCNRSTLDGSINSDGTNGVLTGLAFSDTSTSTGACPNDQGGTFKITAQNLPWSGSTVTYAPVAGGADGTATLANIQVRVDATTTLGNLTCYFAGAGTNRSVSGKVFNPDNAARPVASLAQAQAQIDRARVVRTSGSLGCPSEAFLTGTYTVMGETAAGSGVFDETLYLTH